ncbi:hypothetical protein HPP92_016184 [Vanilla planifolia]|uniref:Methyltransferase n=1 Tax=Vanilla planifolia TaxID=51239 RepID=A0A835URV0_VANPL|nr:hypothetical protein HPP92_016184 [Vanilla planifolia]
MSRALHRGFTGSNGRSSISSGVGDSLDNSYELNGLSENELYHELPSPSGRSRNSFTAGLLRLGLAFVVIISLWGSLHWARYISTASQLSILRVNRRLQEQLLADLSLLGGFSHGIGKLKELEFCPPEYENHVPCYYNASDFGETDDPVEFERHCVRRSSQEQGCLILAPRNYRIPLRWPTGRDFIWKDNVKITGQEFSSGSLTKRMMVEEDQISFRSDSLMVDGVEDYSHRIAEMIGLRNESNFNEAGVRTVLDIGCGFGSFGAHLSAMHLLTLCIANYEPSGSQVQLTLERGLPAMIGGLASKQLPFRSLAFDMVHCARCGIDWEKKDGIFLVEVDRILRPGGYFVWTSLTNTPMSLRNKDNQKNWVLNYDFAENLCWEMLSQQDETIVWRKTSKIQCYNTRKAGLPLCDDTHDIECPYCPHKFCIGRTRRQRWIPIEERRTWPSQAIPNTTELSIYDIHPDHFIGDSLKWKSAVQNYWSLLSPLIFSDHPKRPSDEDPSPPCNMLRNVLDMNAQLGGFNAALVEARKAVWVMNVVPPTNQNYLSLIFDRGFIGVQHDWCEAFPTYPRTYDMVHAQGLLSMHQHHTCSINDIFLEVDRILRPEGWVIIRDTTSLVEAVRSVSAQLKWEARLIEIDGNKDEKLLVCQKPFFKKQLQ